MGIFWNKPINRAKECLEAEANSHGGVFSHWEIQFLRSLVSSHRDMLTLKQENVLARLYKKVSESGY